MRHSAGHSTLITVGTRSETKNYDTAILSSCGLGLVGLAAVGYALAVGFGIERQIIELLTVVMP
jgi:hypothetical protein